MFFHFFYKRPVLTWQQILLRGTSRIKVCDFGPKIPATENVTGVSKLQFHSASATHHNQQLKGRTLLHLRINWPFRRNGAVLEKSTYRANLQSISDLGQLRGENGRKEGVLRGREFRLNQSRHSLPRIKCKNSAKPLD